MANYIVDIDSDKTLIDILTKYAISVEGKLVNDASDTYGTKIILDLKDDDKKKSEVSVTEIDVPITNWDRIKRRYSAKELQENEPRYPTGNVLVKQGTQLIIRNYLIDRDALVKIDAQLKREINKLSLFQPFISKSLERLLRDPKYIRQTRSKDGLSNAKIENNDLTVYVWCRAASTWLNISPFVQQIQTQVTSQLGSFSLTVSDLVGEIKRSPNVAQDIEGQLSQLKDTSISSILSYNKEGETWRSNFMFNTLLQENDLVYIKFEKLEADTDASTQLPESTFNPANKIWDMIGLIDSVSSSSTPSSYTTSVSGRDLMKILIEDGSFFFPEQFAQNIFTDPNSVLTKRNLLELEVQSIAGASYTFKTIETILKFIFNKFSNIGLVPNPVFNIYGDKIIKNKFQLKSSELKRQGDGGSIVEQLNKSLLREERQGVWRICDFIFDPSASQRVLADNSITQENGSILNSIKKFCQEPFVEFYGDTYGSKYDFIIRKQPFDRLGYTGLVYGNYKTNTKEDGVNTTKEDLSRFGEFKSLLKKSGVNDPLDPFGKINSDLKSKIADDIRDRSISFRQSHLSDMVIDIEDEDVLTEQFVYHDEAYSWYRLIPRGLGIPDEQSRFILAPIIPFDEYAEVWGNKMMTMEYNYSPSEYMEDVNSDDRAEYLESQVFYDLQFLIQSSQYLPFARKGVITLTGNRTIKRGTFIYYKPTREVFYVDSVSHIRTMNAGPGGNLRTTTINVSRGLREPFIKGIDINIPGVGLKKVSYFNIINTEVDNKASIANTKFLKNWRVDKDIFSFFLQRRQWADTQGDFEA